MAAARLVCAVPHGHYQADPDRGGASHRTAGPLSVRRHDGRGNVPGLVRQGLVPVLGQGDVVIMDNLATHKVAGVQEALAAAGALLLYLPPYSPDLNPIENLWSKVKQLIHACNPPELGTTAKGRAFRLRRRRLPGLLFKRRIRYMIYGTALLASRWLSDGCDA